jgi:hypothetical protein
MVILQLALALVAVVLDFGPFGRQASPLLSLSSGLVLVWAFSWFGSQRDAFRFAVMQGVLFGLIGFTSPVTWVIIFVGSFFLVDILRGKFFEASSVLLALLSLAIASVWAATVLGIATASFDLLTVAASTITNCFAGIILYYAVGIRFKFLQRWAGRRL